MRIKNQLCVVALLSSASMAMAFTPITNVMTMDSGFVFSLQSLTAGGNTFSTVIAGGALDHGTTTGLPQWGTTLPNMDDFDLNTRASGATAPAHYPVNTIFDHYAPDGTTRPDFFLFEAAGSSNPDDILIAPIFMDGSFGAYIPVPTTISPTGWGNTGRTMTQQQAGQVIAGIAWDITEMMDGNNAYLTQSSLIKCVSINYSIGGIDPCSFVAVPEPGTMAMALLSLGGLVLIRKRLK